MIVDFKAKKFNNEYRKYLKEICNELNEILNKLETFSFNLAVKGKWKEWSDSVSIGTELNVTEDMLLDTGDEIVTELIQSKIKINKIMNLAEYVLKK